MKVKLSSVNPLGLLSGLAMIIAMLFPWWSMRIASNDRNTDLYPYLLNGPLTEFIGYKRSPQMTLLTAVLILTILLILVGSFLKARPARIMLFSAGTLILLAVWRLLVRVNDVASRFDVPLQGHGIGGLGGFAKVEVWTWLKPGLFLAIAGGVLALLAGMLYSKVRVLILD